jgi:chromosome segregation protein
LVPTQRKSNLVDAIRWVLGEQHPGALRCKRTEDLIFSAAGGERLPVLRRSR